MSMFVLAISDDRLSKTISNYIEIYDKDPHIYRARNNREMIDAVEEQKPDYLICTDFLDGLDTSTSLRTIYECCGLPQTYVIGQKNDPRFEGIQVRVIKGTALLNTIEDIASKL